MGNFGDAAFVATMVLFSLFVSPQTYCFQVFTTNASVKKVPSYEKNPHPLSAQLIITKIAANSFTNSNFIQHKKEVKPRNHFVSHLDLFSFTFLYHKRGNLFFLLMVPSSAISISSILVTSKIESMELSTTPLLFNSSLYAASLMALVSFASWSAL